ncbi:VanZ family protein [Massilia haematophila]|uniref:VanZ family protein n=1 Tax=Massilia haematophila TaxID=457923 RepID=A0ABV7PDV5_9BURK
MPPVLYFLLLDPRLRKLRYGCAIAMFAAIVVAGSIPGARADVGQYASGLVLHSAAYATPGPAVFTAGRGSAAARSRSSVAAIAVMGAIDELVQSFFPYRGADVHDWLVDCSAAVVACAILWMVLPRAELERG